MVDNFYELDVWKEATAFTKDVYDTLSRFPPTEKFGLVDQLRRASVSVPTNIAEGLGRFYYKEKIKFLYLARGSLVEVQSLLLLSVELGFLNKSDIVRAWKQGKICEKLINGSVKSIQKRLKGQVTTD